MKIRLIDTALAIPHYRQVRLPTVAAELSPYAEVEINDENIEPIDDSPVDLVGITAQAYNAPRAIHLSRRFRELGIKTILGGPLATGMGRELLDHFDAVVVGEVEGLGERITRDLEQNQLGGVYRLEQPAAWGNRVPRRELQKAESYYWFNYPIEFSRGCPHRCSFCFGSFAYPTFRTRSLQSIAEDVAQWDHGLIEAVDLNFAADRGHLIEVCRLLEEMNVAGWFGEATLHSLDDEEVLRHLERSNCKMVFIGIESIEQQALAAANKGFNRVEDYRDALRRIQDHGIFVHGGFIFGLDGESPESFDTTARFCDETRIFLASTNIATYYPGTKAYDQLKQQGRLTTDDLKQYDSVHVVARPVDRTAEQVYVGTRRFLKKFYSLWSIFLRSFQAPNHRFSQLVDYWSFNLIYRAYYRMWSSRLGTSGVPWRASADELDSLPHVGGRMPLIYRLLNRSWRFFHHWYERWNRPPARASLLATTLVALLAAGTGVLGLTQLDQAASNHWPVPWPPALPVLGVFGLLGLLGTWLTTRLARVDIELRPAGRRPRSWRRVCSLVALLIIAAPMAMCSLVLPLPARGWAFVMSSLTLIFLLKSWSVITSDRDAAKNGRRVGAFILLYPTLDFDGAFQLEEGPKRPLLSHLPLAVKGLAKLAAGVLMFPVLLYLLIQRHDAQVWISLGHLGRLLLLYLVICGLLEWLTAYWRMAGYRVPSPFAPWSWAGATPVKLWRGWNSEMHRWLHRHVFLPAGGRDRPGQAALLTFIVSGSLFSAVLYPAVGRLSHEVVLFVAANGLLVALEKLLRRDRPLPSPVKLVFYVLAVVVFLVTAPWLFDVTDLVFL